MRSKKIDRPGSAGKNLVVECKSGQRIIFCSVSNKTKERIESYAYSGVAAPVEIEDIVSLKWAELDIKITGDAVEISPELKMEKKNAKG